MPEAVPCVLSQPQPAETSCGAKAWLSLEVWGGKRSFIPVPLPLLAWGGVEGAPKVSRASHKVSPQCLPRGLLCVSSGGTFQTLPASELLYK